MRGALRTACEGNGARANGDGWPSDRPIRSQFAWNRSLSSSALVVGCRALVPTCLTSRFAVRPPANAMNTLADVENDVVWSSSVCSV